MLQEAVDALIDNGNARSGRAVAATGQRRRLKSLSDMLKVSKDVSARTCSESVLTTLVVQ
jgi:DNA-directed RNA polymerase beta' subunit